LLEKSGKRREGTENEEMRNKQTDSTHLSQKAESSEGMKGYLEGEKREIRNRKLPSVSYQTNLCLDLEYCQPWWEKNRGSAMED
jgi:hypothetical protein